MAKTETLVFSEMSKAELETALLVEKATIEKYAGNSIVYSREFWKAVENRNVIQYELKKRAD